MIGIVVLNYESWNDARGCIESIKKHPPREPYLVFLVDNASQSAPSFDLAAFVEKHGIILIRNRKNLGYNGGNNAGTAEALRRGCDAVLLSNSDVRYLDGSIQELKDFLDRHPQAGIAGPKILDRTGRVQRSCLCRRTGMKEKFMVRTRAHVLFKKSFRSYFGYDRDYDRTFRTYAVLGCCFMMSRRCARAVTPFDDYPLLYEEELMLGIRMEKAGFWTVYDPKAVIVHRHGGSTRRQKAFSFAHNVRSEIYYCREYLHAPRWQVLLLYWYRAGLYLLRCAGSREFWENWKWFVKMTGEEMRLCRKR